MKSVLILVVSLTFYSCASGSKVEEKEGALEEQKLRDKSLEESVRIENEVFQLVGCTMIKNVEVKNTDAKRIPYDIRKKAQDLGGNVLNDLAVRESFERKGETIFELGKKEYLASADVYRCHL